MNLSPELRSEYSELWRTLVPDVDDGAPQLIASAKLLVESHQDHYTRVSAITGVPWQVIGAIHYREGSCNFSTHLHNGDPLKRRTVHVPVGRPREGEPPFTWDDSAIDSLRYEGMDRWRDWSIQGQLYQLELYNGFGYRKYHTGILSPYLWSYCNHEKGPGHYDEDGHWDPDGWDLQVGAAVLLQAMRKG